MLRPQTWRRIAFAHYRNLLREKDYTDTKSVVLEAAKTLYIPIPKAGNSAAKRALCKTLGLDLSDGQDGEEINVHHDPRIPTVPLSEGLQIAGDDWFVFTIVRNPDSRIASAYAQKVVQQNVKLKPIASMSIRGDDSFEYFLSVIEKWPRKRLNDHLMPQSDLLSRALPDPRLRIFRLEEMATSWGTIGDEIVAREGIRPAAFFSANKTSVSKPERPYVEPVREKLLSIYGGDYDALGYARP